MIKRCPPPPWNKNRPVFGFSTNKAFSRYSICFVLHGPPCEYCWNAEKLNSAVTGLFPSCTLRNQFSTVSLTCRTFSRSNRPFSNFNGREVSERAAPKGHKSFRSPSGQRDDEYMSQYLRDPYVIVNSFSIIFRGDVYSCLDIAVLIQKMSQSPNLDILDTFLKKGIACSRNQRSNNE